jgi:hypothetical protein
MTGTAPRRTSRRQDSPEVWSPSAHSAREARLPRVYLTRHLPSSGFLTLLTSCFFPNLPALFHAGSAHGVLSLQGLSPPRSLRALSDAGAFLDFAANRATFKALLPVRIRHLPQWGEPSWEAAALLGFPPSREFLPGTACGVCRRSPQELRRGPKLRNPCGPFTRAASCSTGS